MCIRDRDIIRLGIGDVTLPLAKSVTDAMLKAVEAVSYTHLDVYKRQLCAKLEQVTKETYAGVEYHQGMLNGRQVVVCLSLIHI